MTFLKILEIQDGGSKMADFLNAWRHYGVYDVIIDKKTAHFEYRFLVYNRRSASEWEV